MKRLILILVAILVLAAPVYALQANSMTVFTGDLTVKSGSTTKLFLDNSQSSLAWMTNRFALSSLGVITLGGGATIDNNASASVLKLTETTTQVAGILDVTGNSTLASVDVGGGSGGSGATITAAGAATFDGAVVCSSTLAVAGTATFLWPVTAKATSYNVASTDNGKIFTTRGATGTVAFSLPLASASSGFRIKFVNIVAQTMTVRALTGGADIDKIITYRNATADGLSFSDATGGNNVGGSILAICDGTSWMLINESPNAATVETSLT